MNPMMYVAPLDGQTKVLNLQDDRLFNLFSRETVPIIWIFFLVELLLLSWTVETTSEGGLLFLVEFEMQQSEVVYSVVIKEIRSDSNWPINAKHY